MKRILFLVLFFPLVLIGCNNDDDDDEKSPIIGTWEMISATVSDISVTDDIIESTIKATVSNYQSDKFVFNKSGKFSYYENNELDWDGNYTFSGNNLTLADEDYTEIYTITLSDNSMNLVYNMTETFKLLYGNKVEKVIVTYSYARL